MTIESKDEFFALPLRNRTEGDAFVEQVFTCPVNARESDECPFIVSRPQRQRLGEPRPACPHHPAESTNRSTLYKAGDGTVFRNKI